MKSALHPTGLAVLVPCHNCADFIAECLRSIQDQEYDNWRLTRRNKPNHSPATRAFPYARALPALT